MKQSITFATALVICSSLAISARATDYDVQRSVILPVSMSEAWHRVGDFCDVDDWHPDFSSCTLRVVDGRLRRILTTIDNGEWVEQRIATEAGLSYTYRVVSSPVAVENMVATISVEPQEGTLVTWSARFSSDDPSAEAYVANLIERGLTVIEGAIALE